MNKELKIKATFKGADALEKAVAAAGIDLSYNEKEGRAEIANIQNPPACFARFGAAKFGGLALVLEETNKYGEHTVMYSYNCDLPLLNKFTPFIGCLDNSRFSTARIDGETLHISEPLFDRAEAKAIKARLSDIFEQGLNFFTK